MKNLKFISIVNIVVTLLLCSPAYGMQTPQFIKEIQDETYVENISCYPLVMCRCALISKKLMNEVKFNQDLSITQKQMLFQEFFNAFKKFALNLGKQINKNIDTILDAHITYSTGESNLDYCINNFKKVLVHINNSYKDIFQKYTLYKSNVSLENDQMLKSTFDNEELFYDMINEDKRKLNNCIETGNEKFGYKEVDQWEKDCLDIFIQELDIFIQEDENINQQINNVLNQEVPCPQPFEYQEDENNNQPNDNDDKEDVSEDNNGMDFGVGDDSSEEENNNQQNNVIIDITNEDSSSEEIEEPKKKTTKKTRSTKNADIKMSLDSFATDSDAPKSTRPSRTKIDGVTYSSQKLAPMNKKEAEQYFIKIIEQALTELETKYKNACTQHQVYKDIKDIVDTMYTNTPRQTGLLKANPDLKNVPKQLQQLNNELKPKNK